MTNVSCPMGNFIHIYGLGYSILLFTFDTTVYITDYTVFDTTVKLYILYIAMYRQALSTHVIIAI